MKDIFRLTILLIGWCAVYPLWADTEPFQEDVQYSRIKNPQPTSEPTKIEVLEIFWYGCSHCFHLEPDVAKWLKRKPDDVNFVRFPAIPSDRWEWFAKVFYTAELLGVLEDIHNPLFAAIHDEKQTLNDPDSMAAFFAIHGVPKEKFISTLNSFTVMTKVSRARQLTLLYGITSVPMLIVNGKYRTTGGMAGTGEKMFAVVDYLIEKERPALLPAITGSP